jgi:hypothetical protein
MTACRECGSTVADTFRFCPWCAAPQRRKLVEFFRPHPRDADKALRVSRYLAEDPHVRFSVWDETGVATAAISLDEAERDGWHGSSRARWRGLCATGSHRSSTKKPVRRSPS